MPWNNGIIVKSAHAWQFKNPRTCHVYCEYDTFSFGFSSQAKYKHCVHWLKRCMDHVSVWLYLLALQIRFLLLCLLLLYETPSTIFIFYFKIVLYYCKETGKPTWLWSFCIIYKSNNHLTCLCSSSMTSSDQYFRSV